MKSHKTGLFLELDVWIPEKKIAFEYQVHYYLLFIMHINHNQDPHHYRTSWYAQETLESIQENDSIQMK